jgi:hypothetical protein
MKRRSAPVRGSVAGRRATARIYSSENLYEGATPKWKHHGRNRRYLAHWGGPQEAAETVGYQTRVGLNAQEQAYLDAAIPPTQAEAQEREAQVQREQAAAQHLARKPRLPALRSPRQSVRRSSR